VHQATPAGARAQLRSPSDCGIKMPGGIDARKVSRSIDSLGRITPDPYKRLLAAPENCGRLVGNPECAGINRHVVGDERALQERRTATPSWPRVLQGAP